MASSKEKNKPIPRSFKEIPRGLITTMENIPMPVKNECAEQIKVDISKLEKDKCLKCVVTKDKSVVGWQRYIHSICSNYSRKLNNEVKFIVRVLDSKYIGVWRVK